MKVDYACGAGAYALSKRFYYSLMELTRICMWQSRLVKKAEAGELRKIVNAIGVRVAVFAHNPFNEHKLSGKRYAAKGPVALSV